MPSVDWRETDRRLQAINCSRCKGSGVLLAGFTLRANPFKRTSEVVGRRYKACACQDSKLPVPLVTVPGVLVLVAVVAVAVFVSIFVQM